MFVGVKWKHDFPECAANVAEPPESERIYNIKKNKTYTDKINIQL